MLAVSKKVVRHGLVRQAAMLAVLAPMLFLAACAQQQPPPPAPAPAPAPAPVPPARG